MSTSVYTRLSATLTLAGALTLGAVAPAHAAATSHAGSATVSTKSTMVNSLTTEQALAEARATGKTVQVETATTASSTLAANPDGSYTLTQTLAPVRKMVAGTWKTLDATLTRNSDGTLSPAVATGSLTLSDGGAGPLATMRSGVASLALTLPVTLPTPTLNGASATYPAVLPGVDLTVTADTLGGFSEVLTVENASAAANPALSTLTFATTTTGVTLSADAAGNITARDPHGSAIFTAPAPTEWDSATTDATVPTATDPTTGAKVDARTGVPLASSADQPGIAAHIAAIKVAASNGTIRLTSDKTLLNGKNTRYPVYIDPSYSAGSSSAGENWTYVSSAYPTTSYWKTTSDDLHVGYTDWDPDYISTDESFYTENIPSQIDGATVNWADAYFDETYSPSCTAEPVQLWRTGTISRSTTDDNQPTWISELGSDSTAHGYSSSCQSADLVYPITSTMVSAASGSWPTVTFGLKSGTSSDLGWKKFSRIATITTNYDHKPNQPTSLTTSPNASLIGEGDVTLSALVSDPDGGTVDVAFDAYVTGHASEVVDSTSYSDYSVPSHTFASMVIPKVTLNNDVISSSFGGTASSTSLAISWNVTVSDGTLIGETSAIDTFTYSTATPGTPYIYDSTGTTDCVSSIQTYQVGTAAAFTFKPNGGTTTPTSYTFQLNGAAPISVTAASGDATVDIKPARRTNILTVTAVAASGNLGQTASCPINAQAAANAVDKDFTGDGIPDLLTVGGTSGVPAGLWLATGSANGQVTNTATDVGANGNGADGDQKPADFTGAQAVTGQFTDDGFQDVMAYYPTGTNAGEATVLSGSGDGSVIEAQDEANEITINPGAFEDGNSDNPLQLANAYSSASSGNAYPDLIGTSGDSTNGYYLAYYPNSDGITGFGTVLPVQTGSSTCDTTIATGCDNLTTPAGGTDWNNWTIATTQVAGDTDMYLWDSTTGALYLWQDFTVAAAGDSTGCTSNNDTGLCTASFTSYEISTGWNTGQSFATLEAADINGDGIPDIWTVTTAGTTTAYLTTDLTTTPTITAQPPQTLNTATHTWPLNDQPNNGSPIGTAADTTGNLPATATTGATGHNGDLFSPDANLDGVTGSLTTTAAAIAPNTSFSISAWVKPTAYNGVVLSQNGTDDSSFIVYPTSTYWVLGFNNHATTAWSFDGVNAATTQLGVWAHLTVTYDATTTRMALYVNGIVGGNNTHTASTDTTTGDFVIGHDQDAGTNGAYFNGQISNVQAWNGTCLTPYQVAMLSETPGYVLFPGNTTLYPSGTTWTTVGATMTFTNGELSIKETASGTTTVTEGTTATSSAVLAMQPDGNLVIYPNATDARTQIDALWATTTDGHPGAVAFLQPDGNFVIYDIDGTVLWASGTDN
jgi:hypothetical protein